MIVTRMEFLLIYLKEIFLILTITFVQRMKSPYQNRLIESIIIASHCYLLNIFLNSKRFLLLIRELNLELMIQKKLLDFSKLTLIFKTSIHIEDLNRINLSMLSKN